LNYSTIEKECLALLLSFMGINVARIQSDY